MKALVFHGPGKRAWEEKAKPAVTDGRILGHEGVGVVDDVGKGVSNFKKGDRVLISCITSCGGCVNCKKGMSSHCDNGGWILGNASRERALKVLLTAKG